MALIPFTLTPATATAIAVNTGTADGNGIRWWADNEPTGWWGAEAATSLVDKVGADGALLTNARLGARQLAWGPIHAVCPSRTLTWTARNQIEAAHIDLVSANGTLVGGEPGGNKTLTVRSVRQPVVTMLSYLVVEVTFYLVAPNPAKS